MILPDVLAAQEGEQANAPAGDEAGQRKQSLCDLAARHTLRKDLVQELVVGSRALALGLRDLRVDEPQVIELERALLRQARAQEG
jgi:hypothetical protein